MLMIMMSSNLVISKAIVDKNKVNWNSNNKIVIMIIMFLEAMRKKIIKIQNF